jgi:hypothetical protein
MPAAGFNPEMRLPTLWTDAPDAMERLRGLYATGTISQAEAGDLAHFIEHGWLLWPKAIDSTLVDQVLEDLSRLHALPGRCVTIDPARGVGRRLNGLARRGTEVFLDLYVNLQSVRQLCMHWRIARFLSLVFQARPLGFQQAVSQLSPGHAWHRDTSHAVVNNPMLLATTWIALEDIAEGSGEPAFYDASHRLPPYVFANGCLHHDGQTSQVRYARALKEACLSQSLQQHRLLGNKGDVFFRAPGLVHRNQPQTGPEYRSSCLSCVTHYCPATSIPHWFADPDLRGIEPFFDFAGFASAHYRLPNLSQVIRPIPF